MYGFLVQKGEKYYTYFTKVFMEVAELHTEYNWILSDIECNIYHWSPKEAYDGRYYWFEGEELYNLLKTEDIQWIWGVFSGIPKEIPFHKIHTDNIPYANGNSRIWAKPLSIQHPMAELELIAWDSTLTIFIGKSQMLIDKILKLYPCGEKL